MRQHGYTLTDKEIEQIDHVQNTAFNAMCELMNADPQDIEWDIEWVGELADFMVRLACEKFGLIEENFYPYMEN